MSEYHLSDIESALSKNHWQVVERRKGDGYRYSAIWIIARPDGKHQVKLLFDGMNDMETLPIAQSYGCSLAEYPGIGMYFSRKGRSWGDELEGFITRLNSLQY